MLSKIALMLAALTLLLAMYLAPTLVAVGRRAGHSPAIVILNILLGWSVIGWVVALVWSLLAAPESETDRRPSTPLFSQVALWLESLAARLPRGHKPA